MIGLLLADSFCPPPSHELPAFLRVPSFPFTNFTTHWPRFEPSHCSTAPWRALYNCHGQTQFPSLLGFMLSFAALVSNHRDPCPAHRMTQKESQPPLVWSLDENLFWDVQNKCQLLSTKQAPAHGDLYPVSQGVTGMVGKANNYP